eukprot:24009_1
MGGTSWTKFTKAEYKLPCDLSDDKKVYVKAGESKAIYCNEDEKYSFVNSYVPAGTVTCPSEGGAFILQPRSCKDVITEAKESTSDSKPKSK